MKNALWFSRHTPTEPQLEEIKSMGLCLSLLTAGMELGALSLESEKDVKEIRKEIWDLVEQTGAKAIFGVFPVPLMPVLLDTLEYNSTSIDVRCGLGIPCFSAWNVMRTVEGGRPTFEHRRFVRVGYFSKP